VDSFLFVCSRFKTAYSDVTLSPIRMISALAEIVNEEDVTPAEVKKLIDSRYLRMISPFVHLLGAQGAALALFSALRCQLHPTRRYTVLLVDVIVCSSQFNKCFQFIML
jgi:hypothetical protein